MQPRLFAESGLTPEQIEDNVIANAHDVEDGYTFMKPYTEEELQTIKNDYLDRSKRLSRLRKELKKVQEPIKAEIKPLEKETGRMIENLTKGGEDVTEKIYLYPDYTNQIMQLYDSRGVLINFRQFTMKERQLSLNSNKTFHLTQKEG